MNPNKPIYHLALVTLEALTAHGIRTDNADAVQDVVLLRDANGLPALPGTSIAGVLRHLYKAEHGIEAANQLFGFAEGSEGQSSDVSITWGLAHDSNNSVAEGLQEQVLQDALLYELSQEHPIVRQRVRLDARGTAEDTGKFDVSLIPAGTRYSTLIGYWSSGSAEDERAWSQLLSLLRSPYFHIGHSTRMGAGAFKVHALHGQRWDLRLPEQKADYIQRPRTRMAARSLPALTAKSSTQSLSIELNLCSEAGWRVGSGDSTPQTEWRVNWHNDQAEVSKRLYVLPASAVKGALVHRFAFHYRCLTNNWVGTEPVDVQQESAVQQLFGFAGERDQEGQVGLMLIDDVYLANAQKYEHTHNRVDHFTGGVMTGALFTEEVLWKTPIKLIIQLQNNERLQQLDKHARVALQRTLDDLANGMLPLGANTSRGLGVFLATRPMQWSDGGQWVSQGEVK